MRTARSGSTAAGSRSRTSPLHRCRPTRIGTRPGACPPGTTSSSATTGATRATRACGARCRARASSAPWWRATGRPRGSGSTCPGTNFRGVIVAHLDLDAFFAAVEELENPELRRVPLVVGGDPRGRGVVCTANYVARRHGIGSAMSCAEALRRCATAVFVQPRHTLYREYSREVWSIVREVVPTVEQAGIDEGYLDLGEVAPAFDDARAVAETVQAVVRARTRLSCSLGVATSKVVAKVASDRRKPAGLTVVRPGREAGFLAPLPLRLLPGIGPRADERLRAAGIETIGALAALPDADPLLRGKVGAMLRDRARGIDPRPLELSTEQISISQEETFPQDVGDAG